MPNECLIEHAIEIEPAFHDLDPMEVVWHGNYFKYFERARCALLAKIDYDYPEMRESGFAWPVIECTCRFIKPIVYNMKLNVTASMVEYENRLKINYLIRDAETSGRICKGHTVQVALDMRTKEMSFVSPDALVHRLKKHGVIPS